MLQLAPGPIRFDVPESAKDRSIAGKFRSPINLHIGNIGLAMSTGFPVNSNAPLRTGVPEKHDQNGCHHARWSSRLGTWETAAAAPYACTACTCSRGT